jgi:hypothetical protein
MGRSIGIEDDQQFEESIVQEVHFGEGGWSVVIDGAMLFVSSARCDVVPKPGEAMRTYGRGFGYPVRGVVIGGRTYSYSTEEQAEAEHALQVAQRKAQQREEYNAKRDEHDAAVAALPEPFRKRIERFREVGGNEWRYTFESYEVFTCQQAAAFAEACGTVPELHAFDALPYAEQRKRVPAMAEGHSGNTMGAAVLLARIVLEKPELVPHAHGALCPLVGCEDYGCFAATKEAKEAKEVKL